MRSKEQACGRQVPAEDGACPIRSLRPAVLGRQPERLVGVGFRCWMAGYRTGDIGCWELAWETFTAALGADPAKRAVSDLACWVRAIRDAAGREIDVYPAGCAGFCRDECMAIAMIAASQHEACPALRVCAEALVGSRDVGAVLDGARGFAVTLREIDQLLLPASIFMSQTAPTTAAAQ